METKEDVRWVTKLIVESLGESTLKTIGEQCQTHLALHSSLVWDNTKPIPWQICGIIGLTAKDFSGTVILGFPESVYLGLISSMLGQAFDKITHEIADGAAELLNMIFGTTKAQLNHQHALGLQMTLPLVILGQEVFPRHVMQETSTAIPFTAPMGTFHLVIGVSRKLKEGPKRLAAA